MDVRFRHLILSLAAGLSLAACQDKEMENITGNGNPDTAPARYLAVDLGLTDGGTLSRAVNGGFQQGEENSYDKWISAGNHLGKVTYHETEVLQADFYLFDKEGAYQECITLDKEALEAQAKENGTDNIETVYVPISALKSYDPDANGAAATEEEFIEKKASYLLVALNGQEFKKVMEREKPTLEGVNKLKAEAFKDFVLGSRDGDSYPYDYYFFMSNSAYNGAAASDKKCNTWAVPITTANLKSTPAKAKEVPVEVFVERREAKLTAYFDESIKKNDDGTFSIKAIKGGNQEVTLRVKFLSWGVNAAEKGGYFVKQIGTTGSEVGNWQWNNAENHRSHFAMTLNYNQNQDVDNMYGITFQNWAEANAALYEDGTKGGQDTGDSYYLNYYSLKDIMDKDMAGEFGAAYEKPLYTNEHMPTLSQMQAMLRTGDQHRLTATHWLLTAQVLGYEENGEVKELGQANTADGEKPEINKTFFNWLGHLWSEKDLVANLLATYKHSHPEGFNAYRKEGEKYIQVTVEDFMIADDYDGRVKLALNEDRVKDGGKDGWVYKKSSAEGDYEPYVMVADKGTLANAELTSKNLDGLFSIAEQLAAYNKDVILPMGINGFKDGYMYYHIPVEHLGLADTDKKMGEEGYYAEVGDYALVGNHWYRLKITEVAKLGRGIFDPNEDIIPNKEENTVQGLGFKMEVCPWHVLSWDDITINQGDYANSGESTGTGTAEAEPNNDTL